MSGEIKKLPRLVIIEGADGTGKTTAVRYACAMLARANVSAVPFHHRAPDIASDSRSPWQRALAFAAQRAELANDIARGAHDGTDFIPPVDIILCDRWWHSTHVEAFRTSDSAMGTLVRAEELALPKPLVVIVLDAPDHVLDARMSQRGEKPTQADRDRRSIYRECAGPAHAWDGETITRVMRGGPPPVVVVDSSGAVEDTAKRVATEVLRAMGRPVVGWDGDGREVACVG